MAAVMTIPRPANEAARLAALRRYQLLDTPAEVDAFAAACICAPSSCVPRST